MEWNRTAEDVSTDMDFYIRNLHFLSLIRKTLARNPPAFLVWCTGQIFTKTRLFLKIQSIYLSLNIQSFGKMYIHMSLFLRLSYSPTNDGAHFCGTNRKSSAHLHIIFVYSFSTKFAICPTIEFFIFSTPPGRKLPNCWVVDRAVFPFTPPMFFFPVPYRTLIPTSHQSK